MKVATANIFNRRDRSRIACDVEEELQFHIEMLERKFTQHGMSSTEAKAAALRRFGDRDRIKNLCIQISKRRSSLRRVLKTVSVLLALTGLVIRILSSHPGVAHIGDTLIMIAISGRLLLYVRGLSPSIFLTATKEASVPVIIEPPEDGVT
jgi:hypothetical protein